MYPSPPVGEVGKGSYSKASQRCPQAPLRGSVSVYNYASYAVRNTPPKTMAHSKLAPLLELREVRYVGKG